MTTSVNTGESIPVTFIGALTGGIIGIIASFVPVFHWEMAGLFVIVFATAAGAVAGVVSARRGVLVGGVIAAVPFGVLFAAIAGRATLPPDNPNAIPTWGTVAVIVAAFAAAAVSALNSRAKDAGNESEDP